MSHRDQILAQIRDIAALPPARAKVLAMLQDPESDLKTIAKVIEHDAAMAASVLKLANSSLLGGVNRIGSIQQALVRLGTTQVTGLLIGACAEPMARKPIAGYDLSPGELWERSVASAIASMSLAETLELRAADMTFTAALLHDIGKVVLGTFVGADVYMIQSIAFEQGISFEQAEHQVLGIDHAEVGAALLNSWKLPADLVQVVRWHHQPQQYAGDNQLVMDLVHSAAQMVTLIGLGAGVDGTHYAVSNEVALRLKLKPSLIESVLCETMSELEDIREMFTAAAAR